MSGDIGCRDRFPEHGTVVQLRLAGLADVEILDLIETRQR